MKIYVETSVILIALFGDASEREKSRYPFVQELFEWINSTMSRFGWTLVT